MFLHMCVILFTGGVSGQGEPPQAGRTPWLGDPPGKKTPQQGEPPPKQGEPPPVEDTTHPGEVDASIRSMSGRYASYWNAFLFLLFSQLIKLNFYQNCFFESDIRVKRESVV